jgi:hypothetical protein
MAAPKYNLYALGNNGGRPAHYDTPEQLEAKVKEYFDWCIETKTELAISGLSQYLGFIDRQSMYDYEKRGKEFSCVIKKARQAVELSYELDLRTFKFGGSIFALKNINKNEWKDKTEQEVHQTINNVAATFGAAIQPAQEPTTDTQLDKE